ncbi:MAG: L-alanine-DL-glutamate epimerase [Clostridia bacterium]|nr:L-alanine-DL-glutamate epimerase [Clostridia bacterium]
MNPVRICSASLTWIREPLKAPFGFKGRYLDELWQTVVLLESGRFRVAAPCVESVLWSDAAVFAEHAPAESSALMMSVTEYALRLLEGWTFTSPEEVLNGILPEVKRYADRVCGRTVALTFVLNALVGLDLALWMLTARENGWTRFDDLIPEDVKPVMDRTYPELAHIPLLSYAVPDDEIERLSRAGTGLLKIKIGKAVPGCSGHEEDMRAMVDWDVRRVRAIHEIASRYPTGLTESGHILYYLDANGRYDTLSRVEQLLDGCDKAGLLDRIVLLEEPFAPENEIDVRSLPVCVNADESAHSLEDVRSRMALGYRAVALKPIAKTLSVSFRMAYAVLSAGGQCLCADLTVNPFLAEWNKQFAARISPLDGMRTGCVEVNGNQNYLHWEEMKKLLPDGMTGRDEAGGRFALSASFYEDSGLLFGKNGYEDLFETKTNDVKTIF